MNHNTETRQARRRVRSRPANDLANKCRRCGGPCSAYAGSQHGWTCRTCLSRGILGDHDTRSEVEPLPLLSDSHRSPMSIENAVRVDALNAD